MKKRLARIAIAIAVGLALWAGLTLAQQDPWWNPRNPFGQSYGVTYGTNLPTLANTGMQPVDGLLAVQLTAGAGPTLNIYDASTAAWLAFVPSGAAGITNNTIPVWDATTNAFEDSLLTDDGTNITLTSGQFLGPNGAVGTPTYSFSGNTNAGVYNAAGIVRIAAGGVRAAQFLNSGGVGVVSVPVGAAATPTIIFDGDPNTGSYQVAADTYGISAGGVLSLQVSADGILPRTYTFATLPASANGNIVYCSDCTAGGTPCAGAGNGSIAFRLNGAWECTL